MRFAVLVSEFNSDVTGGLLKGTLEYFGEQKIGREAIDVLSAPGAFELPLLAKKLAKSGKYAGVVCLGAVIKGDTAHFEFISLGTAVGIQLAALETETPIAFGVLTTYTEEQAIARSRADAHNKGREAAAACLKSAKLIREL